LLPIEEIKKDDGTLIKEVGHTIKALITRTLSSGVCLLSVKNLLIQTYWEELKSSFKENTPIIVKITEAIKGGFKVVYKDLITGFLPFSQSYFKEKPTSQEEVIGKEVEVKILSLENKKNFVVSRRVILEEEFKKKKEKIYNILKEKGIIEGTVIKQVKGGFLIDIEKVYTGFLPFKELSWQRLEHPETALNIGDKLKFKVIHFDEIKERITLSLKQLEPDPWLKVSEKYKEGDRVKGKVVGIFNFGVFVEIEPGIEGLIPKSEISWKKKIKPSELFEMGDLVEGVIINIEPEKRKLLLSLKQLKPNPWEEISKKLKKGDIIEGKIVSIHSFGMFVEIEEGVDGFVPNSYISWEDSFEKKEKYKVGDIVKAQVMDIDLEKKKILLSIKHTLPDPFQEFISKYKEGDCIKVKIKERKQNGFVVEAFKNIKGFLPFSEVWKNPKNPSFELNPDSELDVVITKIEPSKRSFLVSYLAYQRKKEKEELEKYIEKHKQQALKTPFFTLGEKLSQILKNLPK